MTQLKFDVISEDEKREFLEFYQYKIDKLTANYKAEIARINEKIAQLKIPVVNKFKPLEKALRINNHDDDSFIDNGGKVGWRELIDSALKESGRPLTSPEIFDRIKDHPFVTAKPSAPRTLTSVLSQETKHPGKGRYKKEKIDKKFYFSMR